MGTVGVEPTSQVFQARAKTTISYVPREDWWDERELNPRRAALQAAALPTELPSHNTTLTGHARLKNLGVLRKQVEIEDSLHKYKGGVAAASTTVF